MTRTLVVGAHGFLGRHVAAALAVRGPVLCPGRDRFDPLRRTGDELAGLLRTARAEVVVNVAGRTAGTTAELAAANTELVRRLADACRRTGVRLVHLGSAAEYGGSRPGVPVRETDPVHPASAYGRSKLDGTLAALGAGPDAVVLRVFNPVGRGQPVTTLPGRVLAQVRAGGPRADVILGPLDASRDFVAADDVARAVVTAVRYPGTGGIVNVGGGRAVPVRDVVQQLLRLAGHRGAVVSRDGRSSRTSPGVDWQQADIGRADELWGWRPTTDLADALRSAVAGAPAGPRRLTGSVPVVAAGAATGPGRRAPR